MLVDDLPCHLILENGRPSVHHVFASAFAQASSLVLDQKAQAHDHMAHHDTEIVAHNHLGAEETSQRLGIEFTNAKYTKPPFLPNFSMI
jgi:hypothetical protein